MERAGQLTGGQRAALRPAFEKLEVAYQELEAQLAAVGGRPPEDDPVDGGGFCGICTCSSFQGSGTRCARSFCGHRRLMHNT
jgi:hypothetical protein